MGDGARRLPPRWRHGAQHAGIVDKHQCISVGGEVAQRTALDPVDQGIAVGQVQRDLLQLRGVALREIVGRLAGDGQHVETARQQQLGEGAADTAAVSGENEFHGVRGWVRFLWAG